MADPTLKQMRYFEALARYGHFGRAAEASAISQPALSVQIRELENTLGAALFERGARGARLTAFGRQVAERVRAILRAVDELGELGRISQGGFSGSFRLGVIPTVAPYLLPSLVATLSRTHPELDLVMRETITPRLIDGLQDGSLDAALVALPISDPSLTTAELFDEPFLLVRPERDADAPTPAPDALDRMRLLLLEEGHCFRDQALAVCATTATGTRHGLDGSSLSTLVQMVGAGLGITLIPEMAVPVETRSAPVAATRFPDPQPSRRIGLVWRRSSPLAASLEGLAETLRAAAAAGWREAATASRAGNSTER
ncbi:Morphology and auto-aggregation control protein [Jannaschia seosinensis]|uniref:Morphology and auto-aggregation control protein n=1 Tax=Jannaschia seosinensis TaxID=313367 RepID=A0A0M7BH50_9RHOB|nr:hydrogen peroxide-inducible genes activator [Jannaschia seosinensis]CUH40676.1 Morphology and auto-aggregation control protein [Jannaschia seosinensis]